MEPLSILILGEFDPQAETHQATDLALTHAAEALRVPVRSEWRSTADARGDDVLGYHGLLIAPGSPYRDLQQALDCIRIARERRIPALGTCGGFQHMVLETARHVLGYRDAQHAEYDPYASDLFISRLSCSLAGKEMPLRLEPTSDVAQWYGATEVTERYYCNFAIEPARKELLAQGVNFVGWDTDGSPRILSLPQHPFFVGTLFVPQARSRPGAPHPLLVALLRAAQT